QTRLYRLGLELTPADGPREIMPVAPATRIGDNVKRHATETSDLPVGAIVLLSDGGQNGAGGGWGISRDVLQALRNRRLPVHTVGFGKEESAHDVEIEDVSIAASAIAEGRISATVTSSIDRKSTRLNSSHVKISYAVFCLKKKKKKYI